MRETFADIDISLLPSSMSHEKAAQKLCNTEQILTDVTGTCLKHVLTVPQSVSRVIV